MTTENTEKDNINKHNAMYAKTSEGLSSILFPEIGDTVIEHFVDDDAGVDSYIYHTMINSINDDCNVVYILKSKGGHYNTAIKSDFLSSTTHHKDWSDDIIEPTMIIPRINNKEFEINTIEENYSIVYFDVFKNKYSISLSSKSSKNVLEDIIKKLDEMINDENFHKFIGRSYKFEVRWKNNDYRWQQIS